MTSGARNYLSATKLKAISESIVTGFKFNQPHSILQLNYTHNVVKIITRTGELIIKTSNDTTTKTFYWIIGTPTLLQLLKSNFYKKII